MLLVIIAIQSLYQAKFVSMKKALIYKVYSFMKKILAVLPLSFVIASSAIADNFVGGSFGYISESHFHSADVGIKIGSYFNKNVRGYGSLNFNDYDGARKNVSLTGSLDYLFGSGAIKPFAGISLGTNWSQFDYGKKRSNFAPAYGGQAGVIAQAGSVDLELGYRYLVHDNSKKFTSETDGKEFKMESKNTNMFYVSASYRF